MLAIPTAGPMLQLPSGLDTLNRRISNTVPAPDRSLQHNVVDFEPPVTGPLGADGPRIETALLPYHPGKKLDWEPQLARLSDPFDPIEALRHSAAYLRELQNRFGNLGLAAAAYNVGPTRVSAWLTSHRPLPSETRNYLALVTG
jgi:hypothetical protein